MSNRRQFLGCAAAAAGFPSIVKAGAGVTEWMVVEIDSCATDMMEAVERSYKYLVGNKLAAGKK